jgi:hypothetical protein
VIEVRLQTAKTACERTLSIVSVKIRVKPLDPTISRRHSAAVLKNFIPQKPGQQLPQEGAGTGGAPPTSTACFNSFDCTFST